MSQLVKKTLINCPTALFSVVAIGIIFALPHVASAVTFVDTDPTPPFTQPGTPAIQWVMGVLMLLAFVGLIIGIVLAVNARKSGRHKLLALVLIIISAIVVVLTPFVWALISFGLST